MKKEQVLAALEGLGFELEDVGEFGYYFKFEDLNYLYMPDEDDEEFLRLAVPSIFDVTPENRPFVLEIVNDINLSIKHSKTCVTNENVWSFYEDRLFEENHLEDVIEHGIRLLQVTVGSFYRKIEGDDTFPDDDNDNEMTED